MNVVVDGMSLEKLPPNDNAKNSKFKQNNDC